MKHNVLVSVVFTIHNLLSNFLEKDGEGYLLVEGFRSQHFIFKVNDLCEDCTVVTSGHFSELFDFKDVDNAMKRNEFEVFMKI